MTAHIDLLVPTIQRDLSDDEILAAYEAPSAPWMRVNFVSSLDGAATRHGRSGPLGDDADRRVFALLRRLADVVIVGAGTIRAEGYGAFRLEPEDAAWRAARGMMEHPRLAIVSGSLDLDPAAPVFADAPTRPIVYTVDVAPSTKRTQIERVADVVTAGAVDLDPSALRADLIERGLPRMHCEGGPQLFGTLIASGEVDELCLTLAPTVEAGTAPRITRSALAAPTRLDLACVLQSGSELLLRYIRPSVPPHE